MTKLSRYEQETIINFNAGEEMATVYTREPAVMRKLDALVIEFPEVYRCIGATDIDKTYEMPKLSVSYRKPRKLSEEQRGHEEKDYYQNTPCTGGSWCYSRYWSHRRKCPYKISDEGLHHSGVRAEESGRH